MHANDSTDAPRGAHEDAPRGSRLAAVVEVLPNQQFLVELEAEAGAPDANPRNREVTVHFAGAMRVHGVRLVAGDRVRVEVSAFDPSKGRIVGLGPRRSAGGTAS